MDIVRISHSQMGGLLLLYTRTTWVRPLRKSCVNARLGILMMFAEALIGRLPWLQTQINGRFDDSPACLCLLHLGNSHALLVVQVRHFLHVVDQLWLFQAIGSAFSCSMERPSPAHHSEERIGPWSQVSYDFGHWGTLALGFWSYRQMWIARNCNV